MYGSWQLLPGLWGLIVLAEARTMVFLVVGYLGFQLGIGGAGVFDEVFISLSPAIQTPSIGLPLVVIGSIYTPMISCSLALRILPYIEASEQVQYHGTLQIAPPIS